LHFQHRGVYSCRGHDDAAAVCPNVGAGANGRIDAISSATNMNYHCQCDMDYVVAPKKIPLMNDQWLTGANCGCEAKDAGARELSTMNHFALFRETVRRAAGLKAF
jgi:hypothetical protein